MTMRPSARLAIKPIRPVAPPTEGEGHLPSQKGAGLGFAQIAVMGSLLILALLILAGCATATQAEGPEQPIRFPHNWHVQSVGLDCLFCHRTAGTEPAANIPPVEQCMFCHQVAGRDIPEVQKLLTAFADNQPVDWVRVNRLPDHVRFVHSSHVQAGVTCSICHGEVQNMTIVRQDRALRMADCVSCHRIKNAPTDCWICHY